MPLDKKKIAIAGACVLAVVLAGRALRTRSAVDGGLSEPLTRGAIQESVYGIGTVAANRSQQMKTGVITTVLRVHIKEGDEVRKGARLIELDGIGVMTAPFDGTVTSLSYKAGETVAAQSVILTVTDLTDRYISVALDQEAALRVARGMPVRISFESMREQPFEGAVEALYSSGSDFLARIGAAGLPERVLPGMTADVAISLQRKAGVLLVPVAGIGSDGVRVKRGSGPPFRTQVKTGIIDGEMAEVLDGDLREGDRVVVGRRKG